MKYELYGTNTKKMLNMLIYEILKMYSNEEHPLTQQEILRLLKAEYGVEKCDRRSVKANVLSLIDMGIEIAMEEGEGYYLLDRDLDEEELRWLIDAVLFSRTLSAANAKRLIDKLKALGSKYFEPKVSHVASSASLIRTDSKYVMRNVNTINDAIDQKKKIKFRYNKYGIDKKMHDRGKEYIMNPYQMVASNGRYYLLGNIDKYDNVTFYRIDKMSDVVCLDENVKPMKQVKGLEKGLDLPKHMAEHVYMFHGDSEHVKFKCKEDMMDNLMDWFGKDITITKDDPDSDEILVRVVCNYDAMFYWALQYGAYVEVIEPKKLRDDLRKTVLDMAEKYK